MTIDVIYYLLDRSMIRLELFTLLFAFNTFFCQFGDVDTKNYNIKKIFMMKLRQLMNWLQSVLYLSNNHQFIYCLSGIKFQKRKCKIVWLEPYVS